MALGKILEAVEGSLPWSLRQPGLFPHCSLISEKVELCGTMGCSGQTSALGLQERGGQQVALLSPGCGVTHLGFI